MMVTMRLMMLTIAMLIFVSYEHVEDDDAEDNGRQRG